MRLSLVTIVVFVGAIAAAEPDQMPPEVIPVELTPAQREALIAAPLAVMNEAPDAALQAAIDTADIDEIQVEKHVYPAHDGRDASVSYRGNIHYKPVVRSESRTYKPTASCYNTHGAELNWNHCQDGSWVRVQTRSMKKPVRLNGDLSDEQIDEIFAFIDGAGLMSAGEWITPGHVYQILKYPHAGNRINVYAKNDAGHETFFLSEFRYQDGSSGFELTVYQCGDNVFGDQVTQVAGSTLTPVTSCQDRSEPKIRNSPRPQRPADG